MPCMDCVIADGWREHGGKGPPPAQVYHRSAEMFGTTLDPVNHPLAAAMASAEPVLWVESPNGWKAWLATGVELEVTDAQVAVWFFNNVVSMRRAEGSELERKFAAIALASDYLTLLLSKLALVR